MTISLLPPAAAVQNVNVISSPPHGSGFGAGQKLRNYEA